MSTLTINFTPASPAPVNGYEVKYRPVGTTVYTTVSPNPTSSPVIIDVADNLDYEGTVRSDCGSGSYSPEVAWSVTAPLPHYIGTGFYTWGGVPTLQEACDSTQATNNQIFSEDGTMNPGVRVEWTADRTGGGFSGIYFYKLNDGRVMEVAPDSKIAAIHTCAVKPGINIEHYSLVENGDGTVTQSWRYYTTNGELMTEDVFFDITQVSEKDGTMTMQGVIFQDTNELIANWGHSKATPGSFSYRVTRTITATYPGGYPIDTASAYTDIPE